MSKKKLEQADTKKVFIAPDKSTETRFINTNRNIIEIDENLLELKIRDYTHSVKWSSNLITLFGIFVTFITALLTANFNNSYIRDSFLIGAFISFCALAYSAYVTITKNAIFKNEKIFVESCRGTEKNK